jgi:DNA replication and repair protein RecF
MIVRSLRLLNFRNYALLEVELPAGLVALIGDNGQGKTNLLEALCVLATTKSPLVERDRELMRWDQTETRLFATVELAGERHEQRRLEYSWRVAGSTLSREMKAGGVPQSQLSHWLGQLQVVAFFPHDLVLIVGEPAERRRFLNLELGKARPEHFSDSARYRRALQQRNALLKQYLDARWKKNVSAPEPDAMREWNRQIVTYGAKILEARADFLRELAPLADATHRKLSGLEKPFALEYVPGIKLPPGETENDWPQLLTAALDADHEADARKGSTSSGPHRDDIIFTLGGMDLRRYGSQGQQRLAVLATKIALAHWVLQATGEPPILLLDDALSELDATRRALVLEEAAKFPQSVLTATDRRFLENVPSNVFQVAGGRLKRAETVSASESSTLQTGSMKSEILVETA